MLRMQTVLALGDVSLELGAHQGSLSQGIVHQRIPLRTQAGHALAHTGGHGSTFNAAVRPELFGVRHQVVQRRLHAGMGFIRAIAQANQPVTRVARVVAHLFERFGSDGSQLLIFGLLQGFPHQHHQSAVEEVAHE